ncbi:uncharacterized protein LOC121875338 isoform X2 [Homarus americanus]|uniref:uncharacterized protein LOC121875338 isoform X2 n=1 Tax=Homarus americanus TaxID=6706 RepID=UPI001C48E539|nr:uncharacterized protein LOC121875338 isoform X2 [Homarus americanus]
MSTCMHCLVPTRVLYNASRAACGGVGTPTTQVRDGVYKLLWIIPDTLSNSSSLNTRCCSSHAHTPGTCLEADHCSSRRTETPPQNVAVKEPQSTKKFDNVRLQLHAMNAGVNEPSEMNSKRSRDLLSPLRPLPQKKVKSSIRTSEGTSRSTPLDFIPLPPSPPQEENDFNNFFVIDTRPSKVLFAEKTLWQKSSKKGTISNTAVSECSSNRLDPVKDEGRGGSSISDTRESDKVTVLCDSDVIYVPSTSKSERNKPFDKEDCKNHKIKERTKVCINIKKKKFLALSGDDEIDILYEGPKKNKQDEVTILCTVGASEKKQDPVLSPGRSLVPDTQFRKCHTGLGLKTKPREVHLREEISLPSESLKGNKGSDLNKNNEDTPKFQKVKLIDPDVVEIEDSPVASSSRPLEMEVIDIIESGKEDCMKSESSDDEKGVLDISNSEFVSLQKLQVKDLPNTEIDISDEVLDLRKELERLRKWDLTGLGREVMDGRNVNVGDTMFTAMSYNVLGQTLLASNMYLYSSCKEEHLSWPYRWALLQHEIGDLEPDVLMLQEVQASHYHSHYLPWLTFQGYDGLYKKRTGLKDDGCAIFFKKSKFALIEHSSVEYLQPEAKEVLDRDNIGLLAKLSPVSQPNSPALCVATTHLLFNPRRHDVKLAQVVLLLAEIDRLSYTGEQGGRSQYCPVILTGDFNAEPHSALIHFLKEGRLHYEGLGSKTLARHGTIGPLLGPELFPRSLGLTDRCQHAVLAQSRYLEQARGPIFSLSDKRKLEESLIHLYHSDRELPAHRSANSTNQGPTPSGWFSHGFNFNSVYRHRLSRLGMAPEATTRQDGWTTVDYMLYSRNYSNKFSRPVDGKLKLLARYGLLSGPEADRFSPLPSAVSPSDHFPLAAQFLLRK